VATPNPVDKRRWGRRGARGAVEWERNERRQGDSARRRSVLFKGAVVVWSSGGWSEATPHGEEVGEGPAPTDMQWAAGNSPTVALTGSAWSAPKQGPGMLTRGPDPNRTFLSSKN
jgi:hypothetical protein